jgi:glycosyltransferase involved in cell wall biosynthesis
LNQTISPHEIIVVEDASESDLETWLEHEVPESTYIRHEENRGLAAARNSGLHHATGEYVGYLDDDDEWKPERLERQVEVIEELTSAERTNLGVVYCGVERQSPEGETLSISLPENEGNLADSIRDVGASTYPSTSLFRTDILETIGGFDESLASSIDHDIWMQLAVGGYDARRVQEPLSITYISGRSQMTSDTEGRIEGVRQYVEKWLPTYRDWFGESDGTAYGHRYLARVIARLAAANFTSGDFRGFGTATRAIFEYSDETAYNISILIRTVTRRTAGEVIPRSILNRIRVS